MARSSYIYLALDKHSTPLGAFTVKHELVTWLKNRPYDADCVLRMPDGVPWGVSMPEFTMRGTDISSDREICEHLRPNP